jgi:hypothetical protein
MNINIYLKNHRSYQIAIKIIDYKTPNKLILDEIRLNPERRRRKFERIESRT